MKSTKKSVVAFFIAFFSTGCWAATTGNFYSDNTRELFYIPRSSAVSGSDYVFARDGSPQSNPAHLALGTQSEVTLSYAAYFQNSFSASMLSYAAPIDTISGFGLSLSYLYNPDIRGTQDLNMQADPSSPDGQVPIYDPSLFRTSTHSIIYFHAGYGRKLLSFRSVALLGGIGLNAARQRLPFDVYRGYSMGLDAGLALDFAEQGLRVSLGCDNLSTQYTVWSSTYSEVAYPHLRLGIGWQKLVPYLYGDVRIQYKSLDFLGNEGANALDLNSYFAQDTSGSSDIQKAFSSKPVSAKINKDPQTFLLLGSFGLEYCIQQAFTIRVGGNAVNKMAFGCGVNLLKRKFSLDASYVVHDLAPTYQIGITYRR